MTKKKVVHSAIYGVIEKSDLPKTVKKKALAGIVRIEKEKALDFEGADYGVPPNLANSFIWSQTKEGDEYWMKLHKRMQNNKLY